MKIVYSVKGIIKLEAEDYSDEEIKVLVSLPRLKKLWFRCLPELVSIGNGSWPSLEQIKIYGCSKLKNLRDFRSAKAIKEIKAEKDWWDALY